MPKVAMSVMAGLRTDERSTVLSLRRVFGTAGWAGDSQVHTLSRLVGASDWLEPNAAASLLKVWTLPGRCGKKGCPAPAPGGTDFPTQPWAPRRRHLSYKTGWYGSTLVVAHRWFPSSKTCRACGHVQDIGWDETWQCDQCAASHQRDDCAAINLARYEKPLASSAQLGRRQA